MTDLVLTVSEINSKVKTLLKKKWSDRIAIRGELSNFKISRGHLFSTLKDSTSAVSVICWSFSKKFPKLSLDNGKKMIVYGFVDFNPKGGSFYINATYFKLEGIGDLHQEYIIMKEWFKSLGYFDKLDKKHLPKYIKNIGILTSIDGAAVKDLLFMLKKYNFKGTVNIKDIKVQGNDCPESVIEGLKLMDTMGLDVIILTRGGGSLEHLFGFSHNNVVEQINKTNTCVMSAIGHEIDEMLSDLVSDIRAPTPSIAGEIIGSHQKKYFEILRSSVAKKLQHHICKELEMAKLQLRSLKSTIYSTNDLIKKYTDQNKFFLEKLKTSIRSQLMDIKIHLSTIKLVDPFAILKEGYSLIYECRKNENNYKLITSINQIKKGKNKKLKLKTIDGEVIVTIRIKK